MALAFTVFLPGPDRGPMWLGGVPWRSQRPDPAPQKNDYWTVVSIKTAMLRHGALRGLWAAVCHLCNVHNIQCAVALDAIMTGTRQQQLDAIRCVTICLEQHMRHRSPCAVGQLDAATRRLLATGTLENALVQQYVAAIHEIWRHMPTAV